MDKELTEPKWVLIVWPQNISAQAQKFEIFEKKLPLDVRSTWPGLIVDKTVSEDHIFHKLLTEIL